MTQSRRARILIVDDSAVMRSLLRAVVSSDAQLEVAGTAGDGLSALNSVSVIKPDLILLDLEMPGMDGLTTLRELRRRLVKIPVIMCSSLTRRGAKVTIEALANGAADYVAKPEGQSDRETAVRNLARELLPKIRALTAQALKPAASPAAAAQNGFQQRAAWSMRPRSQTETVSTPSAMQPITAKPSAIAIGVSTGGPAALEVLLPLFPADFPLPVLVVQHMPELFTRLLAERLDKRCNLRVREASHGDAVQAGCIRIARGNWHMQAVAASLSNAHAVLRLTQEQPENHCRPSVDVLFSSLAGIYGSGVLAVVLTGMGSDGLSGCRTIRSLGGTVLAQDEASSAVWGMPGAVARAGLAHKILPLEMMASEILRIAAEAPSQPVHAHSNEVM